MKEEFVLKLEFPGIVLFDPFYLDEFCLKHKITQPEIMEYFINNPAIGDKAISEGVILPIYTIDKTDYRVKLNSEAEIDKDCRFRYNSFPLKITSDKLVIADIYALLAWDDGILYKELEFNDGSTPSQYALEVDSGCYAIDIVGFYKDEENKGYQLVFNKKNELPALSGKSNIDSYNFNVCKYIKSKDGVKVLPRKHEI